MSTSLKRVLRIRALQEERSRMELEAESGRLREIERGSIEAAREARASRELSFAEMGRSEEGLDAVQLAGDAGPRRSGWREAEALWERAVGQRDRYESRRPAQAGRVEDARAEFLAGRTERLQAEALVEAAGARELADEARRGQRALDDWFQSWAQRLRDVRDEGESLGEGLGERDARGSQF